MAAAFNLIKPQNLLAPQAPRPLGTAEAKKANQWVPSMGPAAGTKSVACLAAHSSFGLAPEGK
eukprot:1215839-Rhodomonas_salina.1